jgi:hypothetical protein
MPGPECWCLAGRRPAQHYHRPRPMAVQTCGGVPRPHCPIPCPRGCGQRTMALRPGSVSPVLPTTWLPARLMPKPRLMQARCCPPKPLTLPLYCRFPRCLSLRLGLFSIHNPPSRCLFRRVCRHHCGHHGTLFHSRTSFKPTHRPKLNPCLCSRACTFCSGCDCCNAWGVFACSQCSCCALPLAPAPDFCRVPFSFSPHFCTTPVRVRVHFSGIWPKWHMATSTRRMNRRCLIGMSPTWSMAMPRTSTMCLCVIGTKTTDLTFPANTACCPKAIRPWSRRWRYVTCTHSPSHVLSYTHVFFLSFSFIPHFFRVLLNLIHTCWVRALI